ncbi:MAG TPA: division/cell wall cluster transcriptional repressor MraZ, partial [Methylococcaceae bacterium]|nr:division/cell wall cluster transcriptional repressor MraZ [Methylococcaceae bacterium]
TGASRRRPAGRGQTALGEVDLAESASNAPGFRGFFRTIGVACASPQTPPWSVFSATVLPQSTIFSRSVSLGGFPLPISCPFLSQCPRFSRIAGFPPFGRCNTRPAALRNSLRIDLKGQCSSGRRDRRWSRFSANSLDEPRLPSYIEEKWGVVEKNGFLWKITATGGKVFRGVNSITLDAKSRLAIPTRYRAELQESCDSQLVLTVDRDKCLLLYPLPEWEEIEKRIARLPTLNKQTRLLQRLLIGHATESEMDAQGRLLIPEPLRKFAGLDKNIVLIGQGNKFEIWDEAEWNARREEWLQEESLADLGELSPELSALSF